MERHCTYVQTRPGGFFASCRSCGSDPFPDRVILEAAESDAQMHGTLSHAYPRSLLEEHNRRVAAELPLT